MIAVMVVMRKILVMEMMVNMIRKMRMMTTMMVTTTTNTTEILVSVGRRMTMVMDTIMLVMAGTVWYE